MSRKRGREVHIEPDDIRIELDITATNCGVMLYRARMRLRDCLDRNWFAGPR